MTRARSGRKWLVPGEFWDWTSRLIAGPRNYETDGALMEGFRSETNQNQRVKGLKPCVMRAEGVEGGADGSGPSWPTTCLPTADRCLPPPHHHSAKTVVPDLIPGILGIQRGEVTAPDLLVH